MKNVENTPPSDELDMGGSLLPIQMIPIDRIRVRNPRKRDPKKFQRIVGSISHVGLKKPIRVSEQKEGDYGRPIYDLICGQGRVEAFIALGEKEIPAQVGYSDIEIQLLMSLVENVVRHRPLRFEQVKQIAALKDRGYSTKVIAEKTDLSENYIFAILHLWEKGEERLLRAVEGGTIPVSMAMDIVRVSDEDAQKILLDAYEKNKLRGKRLVDARRFLEDRKIFGKKITPLPRRKKAPSTAEALVRAYQKEVQKQKIMVKKARLCESRLIFVVSAIKRLLGDENFVTLLRAEKINTLPRYLADQVGIQE
jgi:ParB family transcriptional regulator, chromosome partitioning protein